MNSSRRVEVEVYPEEFARRMASILGPFSANALALQELVRRKGLGEDVVLLLAGDNILVGPRPCGYGAV